MSDDGALTVDVACRVEYVTFLWGIYKKRTFVMFRKYILSLSCWPTEMGVGSSNEMDLPSKQDVLVAAFLANNPYRS
jgi:hypothetical protein